MRVGRVCVRDVQGEKGSPPTVSVIAPSVERSYRRSGQFGSVLWTLTTRTTVATARDLPQSAESTAVRATTFSSKEGEVWWPHHGKRGWGPTVANVSIMTFRQPSMRR